MSVAAEHRLLDGEDLVIDQGRVFGGDLLKERIKGEDPVGDPEDAGFGVDAPVFGDEDVHAVRDDLVHDDRVVPVVLRLVRRGELRCSGRHGRGRLEDVVGLQFRREALADLLVLVLLDFAQADGVRAFLVLELVQPVEDVPDVAPHHGRCLAMNQDVRVEEDPH